MYQVLLVLTLMCCCLWWLLHCIHVIVYTKLVSVSMFIAVIIIWSFSSLLPFSSNDMSTYTKARACLHFMCTGTFIQWYLPRCPSTYPMLLLYCVLFIFISQICLWKVLKKRPVATIKQAHDGEGEVWISALRALRNTDLLASGTSSLLQ